MHLKYVLILLIFSAHLTFGQEIKIIDSETNEPIPGVVYYNYNKSKNGVSDLDGKITLEDFSNNETIHFQHTSFEPITLTKSKILKNNGIVLLKPGSGQLDEIVLSVTRFSQSKNEITQSVVSINAEDAMFSQPQTTADLLSNSGKVFVQKSQLGGGSPMIRGFSTNRLLMTVDGVRMNTAIFRGGNIQNILSIDPFIVENTEVILGPGSVVYGSDAVGGGDEFLYIKA